MSPLRLVLASLLHHRRMNFAVACGAAVGTAVLTGALLVGDSMRGSLRRLTLERLGRIDEALVADRFFREKLAEEVGEGRRCLESVPAILLRGSLETAEGNPPNRANQVNVIGSDRRFWRLYSGPSPPTPGRREIVLNQPLAEQLGLKVGDTVILRLPRPGSVPAESPLGRKRETVRGHRLAVREIIPAEGPGRFGLRPTQHLPRNAYVSLDALQEMLEQPGRANAILLARGSNAADDATDATSAGHFEPQLEDYGIRVQKTRQGYFDISSDRMILEPAAEKGILRAVAQTRGGESSPLHPHPDPLPKGEPALTYLANTIACGTRGIPYSTITALDFAARPPLGPFLSADGKAISPLADDQIALNSWAAEDLNARPGDVVRVSYFEPESTHGEVREKTVELKLAAVVELAGAAADRALTPSVPGVTDKLKMANWDPPFPFDAKRVRPKDDEYWRNHRAVPKAFVSLATGRRLWGSRFGQCTSLRIAPPDAVTLEDLRQRLQSSLDPAAMGFVFQPVKEQGLAASAGTTPFQWLFLGFSSFIIAAAVMLVALLFRLGIERRAAETGILLAVGWDRRRIGRLLAAEGLLVAAAGSVVGVAGGIGYAALMLAGLRTWWLAAVATPLLQLHVTAGSLAIGFASGLVAALVAIAGTGRRIARIAPRQLLAGQTTQGSVLPAGARHRWLECVLIVLALAPAVAVALAPLDEDLRAVAFFAAGALALAALVGLIWIRGRSGATGPAVTVGRGNLLRMALRNAARNPGRSTLSIALVAAAGFLIVAVSAFRLDSPQPTRLDSGSGGFALVAQSDQPIYHDLNTREGRRELGFSPQDEQLLTECEVIALRVKPGDDASCLNLYQPRQPRLLGVPPALVQRGGFAWSAAEDSANPWRVLAPGQASRANPVPVILEKNTANYSLHLWKGLGERFDVSDGRGRTLPLTVAGLLAGSIFQGDLLVSEEALLDYDPEVSGYRLFLIQTPPGRMAEVQNVLERNLGDYGLTTETTADRLAEFLAVQNTYLSTFQSLGGLGLLLGTIGLAAVQLRNVLERRGELALLRAAGFRRGQLVWLVLLENLFLLGTGLGAGTLAALVAVGPHIAGQGAAVPWGSLATTLALVFSVGMGAGLIATGSALRTPLLATLRESR